MSVVLKEYKKRLEKLKIDTEKLLDIDLKHKKEYKNIIKMCDKELEKIKE